MIKVQEQNYKEYHRELSVMKNRFGMANAAIQFIITYSINSYFFGKQAAILPFEPYGFVTGMSHRGLEGDDMTQVSMTFICVLIQMSFRGVLGKITGSDGPRLPMDLSTP